MKKQVIEAKERLDHSREKLEIQECELEECKREYYEALENLANKL